MKLQIISQLLLLVLPTSTFSRQSSHPFQAGDNWRGHLSGCEKKDFGAHSSVHVVDLTVLDINESGDIEVLFTEQGFKSQYSMTGRVSC